MTFNCRDLVVQRLGDGLECDPYCPTPSYIPTETHTDETCAGPSCGYPSFAVHEAGEDRLDLLRHQLRQAVLGSESRN